MIRAARFLLLTALLVPTGAWAQLNMVQVANVPGPLEDIWGYSAAGREYALCCTGGSLAIYEVTSPGSPILRANVPATGSDLKDVKTYTTYAYAINQSGAMQIIDLQFLPDSAKTVSTYNSATYGGAHNIIIEGQYAYVTKNGAFPTDLRILDLINPTVPVEVGFFTHPDAGSVFADAHDAFVRDTFCYVANLSAGWVVLSISDITNPQLLAKVTYPGNFTHSMWEDTSGNYLFTTDEVTDGHIRVWDVSDLGNIQEVAEYIAAPGRIVHNCFAVGDFLVISYYGEGVKILDISNPEIPVEVGAYDTSPAGTTGFVGCWGVYPYFPSGTIVASDLGTGLHVLTFNQTKAGFVLGQVTDASSTLPLSDVTVSVIETAQSKTTDLNGDYATGAIPGTYTLVFEKFGFDSDTQTVVLTSGNTETVSVALSPQAGADVNGSVVQDVCGTVLQGIVIGVVGGNGAGDVTDVTGSYNVGFLPAGSYTLQAGFWGFLPAESSYTVVAGPPNTVDFNLSPGAFDDAEADQSWLMGIPADDATTGIWERVDPGGTFNGGTPVAPENDNTPTGVRCFVTGDQPSGSGIGANDIDGGTTTLQSPVFSLEYFLEPVLEYYRWYSNNQGSNPGNDFWTVRMSSNTGTTWQVLENTNVTNNSWQQQSVALTGAIAFTDQMVLQFRASDLGGGSVVEAAVDDIRIAEGGTYGDFNENGNVASDDIILAVNYIFKSGFPPTPAFRIDVDGDCIQNSADIINMVNFVFKSGPAFSVPCSCL